MSKYENSLWFLAGNYFHKNGRLTVRAKFIAEQVFTVTSYKNWIFRNLFPPLDHLLWLLRNLFPRWIDLKDCEKCMGNIHEIIYSLLFCCSNVTATHKIEEKRILWNKFSCLSQFQWFSRNLILWICTEIVKMSSAEMCSAQISLCANFCP